MKNLCLCLIVTGLCHFNSVATFAQQPAPPPPKPNSTLKPVWQELVVPAGNFKIEFPDKPVEQTQTVKTATGNYPLHIFLCESGGTAYLASYVDFSILIDSPASIKTALDNGRDSMLARKDASLISEKEITYGLYPGREIKAKLGNFTAQTYLYLVKQRLYNLSAFTPVELADSKELGNAVQRFLGSFRLLEVPKLPENVASISAALDNIQAPPPDFFARPAVWQELASPEFGFKITIPSAPFRQTVALGPNPTDIKVNLWLAKGDDLFCTVVHQGLVNPPKDERAAELMLNSVVSGMIETDQIQIVSQTPRSLDGHPGRELKLQMGNTGTGRGRAYIVGKNVYAFLAISLGEKPNDQAVARVLDSFKLSQKNMEPAEPPPPPPMPKLREELIPQDAVKVSNGILQGALATKKVQPEYPPIAKAARADGPVAIQVALSETGELLDAVVLDGHPLLREAALAAARQWQFNAHQVNGKAVKAVGILVFNFTLQ